MEKHEGYKITKRIDHKGRTFVLGESKDGYVTWLKEDGIYYAPHKFSKRMLDLAMHDLLERAGVRTEENNEERKRSI